MSLAINEVHASFLEAHKVTPVIKQLSHFLFLKEAGCSKTGMRIEAQFPDLL